MSDEKRKVEFGESLAGNVSRKSERRGIGDRLEPNGKKRNRQNVSSEEHNEAAHDPLERGNFFENERAETDVEVQKREHEESPHEKKQRTEGSSERNFGKSHEIRPDSESEHGHDDEVRKRSRKHFENLENGIGNRIEEMDGDLAGLHVFGDAPSEIGRPDRSDLREHEPPSKLFERNVREKLRGGGVQVSEKADDEQYAYRIGKERRKDVEHVDVALFERYAEKMVVFFHNPAGLRRGARLVERADDFFELRLFYGEILDFSGGIYPFERVFYEL